MSVYFLVYLAAWHLLVGHYCVLGHEDPVPRFHHAMEIFNGQMCVYGGKSTTTGTNLADFLLDFRCVDVTAPIRQANPFWKKLSSASRFAMRPLAQHTSVYNRKTHVIIPYGGQTPDYFSKSNVISVFDTQFQAWGASKAINKVPRRYIHTAVIQESSGDMIVFGGASDLTTDNQQNARWPKPMRMVTDTGAHTRHAQLVRNLATGSVRVGQIILDEGDALPESVTSIAHHASVMVYDRYMVVLGGDRWVSDLKTSVNVSLEHVYIYDVDTLKWAVQECSGDVPKPRSAMSASVYRDSIFIFGGVDAAGWSRVYNDVYQLNITTWTWKNLSTATAPAPRYGHQMKTLGHYLVITNGFLETQKGDADIYFYDISRGEFVDTYSPKGISRRELDTEWTNPVSGRTAGMFSLALVVQLLVGLIAAYYALTELWRIITTPGSAQRPINPTRARIRSSALSFAESIRRSSVFSQQRQSVDEGTINEIPLDDSRSFTKRAKSHSIPNDHSQTTGLLVGSNKGRSQSVSEGSSTVVSSGQIRQAASPNVALVDNMRHTRILDTSTQPGPYISRRLTISSRLPAYTSPITHRSPRSPRTVRFSEDVNISSDAEEDGNAGARNEAASILSVAAGPGIVQTIAAADSEFTIGDLPGMDERHHGYLGTSLSSLRVVNDAKHPDSQ